MTVQEMFTTVKRHLLKQGAKATTQSGVCKYREEQSGRKCAIGCLIPDHLYTPMMEGFLAEGLVHKFPVLAPYIPNTLLAATLQRIHDIYDASYWPSELEATAKSYGLIYDESEV